MPPISVLMKPSSGMCNMACKYCFYCDEMKKRAQKFYGFMSEETLENVIKKTMAAAEGQISYTWQGGEPTLRGLEFFEKAVEYQKKYNEKGIQVANAFQTNGYLMDRAWAQFFKKNHFLVGVSIDGIKMVHDAYRRSISGAPTYDRILETTKCLDYYGVDYNVLTVVHREVAENITAIYEEYKNRGWIYQQYIPCIDPAGQEPGHMEYSLSPEGYGDFLCTLFDLWHDDLRKGKHIHIRQFENYMEMLMGYPPESCGMSGICSFQHVIEADGEVYPCDFYVMDEYRLGNLNVCEFEEIQIQRKKIRFIEESLAIDKDCKKCLYYQICRGGCKRYREPGIDGKLRKNFFCESYKQFFEHFFHK